MKKALNIETWRDKSIYWSVNWCVWDLKIKKLVILNVFPAINFKYSCHLCNRSYLFIVDLMAESLFNNSYAYKSLYELLQPDLSTKHL